MGKARKQKVHDEQGPSKTMKERIVDRMEYMNDNNTAKTRAKCFDLWMEMSGVDTPDRINYDDPRIHLEWLLCDFKILGKLTSGKPELRQEVLDMMDDTQR